MEFGQGYIGWALVLSVYVLHVRGANYFHISYVISIELVSLYYTFIVFSLNLYNSKDIMSLLFPTQYLHVRIMWNLEY